MCGYILLSVSPKRNFSYQILHAPPSLTGGIWLPWTAFGHCNCPRLGPCIIWLVFAKGPQKWTTFSSPRTLIIVIIRGVSQLHFLTRLGHIDYSGLVLGLVWSQYGKGDPQVLGIMSFSYYLVMKCPISNVPQFPYAHITYHFGLPCDLGLTLKLLKLHCYMTSRRENYVGWIHFQCRFEMTCELL